MSADELEQFAERGQDYRHVLSCSVLNILKVPQGCVVEAEYGSEFGGLYPRYATDCARRRVARGGVVRIECGNRV